MSLFQNSVLNKYLKSLEIQQVEQAWNKFTSHFHNPEIQENIRNSKEEQYQEGFLRDLFVNVLGYTLNPETHFNLTSELKNIRGAKKTDGAILLDDKAIAVIELKGTDTVDLDKAETQAFGYKNNQPGCTYVITSNFEKLRFYIDNAVDFEEFNLFQLSKEHFNTFYICLAAENLLKGIPKQIKDESLAQEENVTKKLYKDYSQFRNEIFDNIQKINPEHNKLTLFKKTQKLLDRFLFIFFAEDRLLVPPNSISLIIEKWKDDVAFGDTRPLFDIFKQYFHVLNVGRPARGNREDIFAYNGGLFEPDEILDNITIDDELLYKHTLNLSNYDFESEVSVNILGHIFEHSLTEIETIQAQLEGTEIDKSKTKRKKDGVFYTPKYITKYIVDNTVGKLCEEKKTELNIEETEYEKERKGRKKATLEKLTDKLRQYRQWLLQLTICDPACGSGAFLNQALDFLIEEHRYIDELKAKLLGGGMVFSEVQNNILENNLFGVDINEESVEIAKLSLWLRTAKKGRKLTTLNDNIKCGNSLIDDPEVAGDKAFDWHKEFPGIFREKEKEAFHVVLTTHNSRTSQRMIKYNVEKGPPVELNPKQEIALTEIIGEIIQRNNYNVLAYNVCKDHVHLIIVCALDELTSQIQRIKIVSSTLIKSHLNLPRESSTPRECIPLESKGSSKKHTPFWSQKFYRADLDVWQLASLSNKPGYVYKSTHLENALVYIYHNREKHNLPASKKLQKIIDSFVVDQDLAFSPEYTGGFDVVIGNPPYVRQEAISPYKPFFSKAYQTYAGTADLYTYFIEMSVDKLLSKDGYYSIIVANKWMRANYGKALRNWIKNKRIVEIIDFGDLPVFADATAYPCILTLQPKSAKTTFYATEPEHLEFSNLELYVKDHRFEVSSNTLLDTGWALIDVAKSDLLEKLKSKGKPLGQFVNKQIFRGILTGFNEAFVIDEATKSRLIAEDFKSTEVIKPFLAGRDIKRYSIDFQNRYLIFTRRGIDIEQYPAIKKYLMNFRESLEPKPKNWREKWSGRKSGNYKWFEIQDSIDYYKEFDKPKIIYPNICKRPEFTFDKLNYYTNQKCFIISEPPTWLVGLMNSQVMMYFFSIVLPELRGGFFEPGYIYMKDFPVVNGEILEPFVMIQLEATSELRSKIYRFLKRTQDNLEVEKVSKKMAAFYDHDFKTFIAELKKKKIILSLSEQDEWEEYFTQYKTDINQLQVEIEKTDKEIDQMVYELYGLTEEEIKIVEIS